VVEFLKEGSHFGQRVEGENESYSGRGAEARTLHLTIRVPTSYQFAQPRSRFKRGAAQLDTPPSASSAHHWIRVWDELNGGQNMDTQQ